MKNMSYKQLLKVIKKLIYLKFYHLSLNLINCVTKSFFGHNQSVCFIYDPFSEFNWCYDQWMLLIFFQAVIVSYLYYFLNINFCIEWYLITHLQFLVSSMFIAFQKYIFSDHSRFFHFLNTDIISLIIHIFW